MDLAYDHIAEETYSGARSSTPTHPSQSTDAAAAQRPNLQTEFQETFKAFSSSAWGTTLGGIWGNVKKQGETYLEEAKKEAEAARKEAEKGLSGLRETLVSQTRALSVTEKAERSGAEAKDDADTVKDEELTENETFVARFKSEAAKRLKEVQKAEDAADEALLRFGMNIRNFLKDAVAVAPPDASAEKGSDVLFESRDSTGRRVIHTSRFDAQLHVIHTTLSSFTEDPSGSGDQWTEFEDGFDIEKNTEQIAKDLEQYGDLRSAMETLVPEKVEYKDFWTRYYFLRHVVETQEERRKELLKGMLSCLRLPLALALTVL